MNHPPRFALYYSPVFWVVPADVMNLVFIVAFFLPMPLQDGSQVLWYKITFKSTMILETRMSPESDVAEPTFGDNQEKRRNIAETAREERLQESLHRES